MNVYTTLAHEPSFAYDLMMHVTTFAYLLSAITNIGAQTDNPDGYLILAHYEYGNCGGNIIAKTATALNECVYSGLIGEPTSGYYIYSLTVDKNVMAYDYGNDDTCTLTVYGETEIFIDQCQPNVGNTYATFSSSLDEESLEVSNQISSELTYSYYGNCVPNISLYYAVYSDLCLDNCYLSQNLGHFGSCTIDDCQSGTVNISFYEYEDTTCSKSSTDTEEVFTSCGTLWACLDSNDSNDDDNSGENASGSNSLSGGAIAGIIVGSVVGVCMVGGIIAYFYRKHSTTGSGGEALL